MTGGYPRRILILILLITLFLAASDSQADLDLPTTGCDSVQNTAHLVPNMPQEDGTKTFTYGSDNVHFASRTGSTVTLNANLLFTTTNSSIVKFFFMSSTCSSVAGLAFQFSFPQINTFTFNLDTDKLGINNFPGIPIFPSAPVQYIWIEVLDKYPNPTISSYSYLVNVDDIHNPEVVEDEPPPPPTPDPPPDPSPMPPPPPTPSEPSGLRPVLIIPGIMGSELYDGDDFIWPNVSRLISNPLDGFLSESLSLDENGNSIRDITVGDIVRKIDVGILRSDTFEALITLLESNNYEADTNLFIFPYDWRLDLGTSQTKLDEKIEEIKAQTGFDKVDIVAHSMGGLVAEDYIRYSGTNSIDNLIFVGTPHLGATKAAMALLTGNIDAPWRAVNKSRIKEIAQNAPAIYELLPNPKYFEIYQGYIKVVPQYGILDYDQTLEYLSSSGKNTSLLNLANSFFNQGLYDLDFGNANVFNIVGCHRASTKDIIPIDGSNGRLLTPLYSNGDGTVPFVSADYISPDTTAYYVKGGKHAELPSMNGVRQLITGLLAGEENLDSNIGTTPGFCPINGKELNWRSPVEVQIYDAFGNHTGPLPDGTLEEEIPGVTYEIIDDEAYIFLPTDEGQTYTIQGTGTADSSFDLIISDISNDEIINNILFDNVHILPGSSISFTVSEDSDNTQITADGDIISTDDQFGDPGEALLEASSTPPDDPTPPLQTGSGIVYSQPDASDGKILGEVTTKQPDGTLVLDILDNRTVYMIGSEGKKYGFTNEEAFTSMGFSFKQAVLADVSAYELGGLISYSDQIHPNGTLAFDGQTIWLINNDKRHGFTSMEEFISAGFNLKQVIKINQADLLLEEKL